MSTYRQPTDLDRAALRAMGHRIPLGCDQQGRYPQAAEAATDVGADDNEWSPLSWSETAEFWGGVALLVVGALVLCVVFWPN